MQTLMDFGLSADIAEIRALLSDSYGRLPPIERRAPMAQLVRSLLGGRTKDADSVHALGHLMRTYPRWEELLAARVEDVVWAIRDVTFPERKAQQLLETARLLSRGRQGFDVSFLGGWPLGEAMAWLMRLPGVGAKVAASTLNFSTLDRAVFVADSHVLRVLGRYGIAGPDAEAGDLQDLVTGAMDDWTGADFAEFHRLLKLHGQSVCPKPRPRCGDCTLADRCRHARNGGPIPARAPMEAVPAAPA